MKKNQKLQRLLILHEDLRLIPYRCPSGFWTWGVGHNLEANPLSLTATLDVLNHGPTFAVIQRLLEEDIQRTQAELSSVLPWVADLDEVRQVALLDMAFNMGVSRLATFRKMLGALQAREWGLARQEALDSRWAEQVKTRATRVADMLLTGEWPAEVADVA